MMQRLRELLEQDEGCVYSVYLDSLDKPTLGIGHLIVEGDAEYGWPVGAPVSEERVSELFEKDVQVAINDARWLHPDLDEMPEGAQITIISLAYQLGMPRYSMFVKHHAGIELRRWKDAAAELRDSKLYRQTPQRTERHAQRLENIAGTTAI
jgi:GH24 family phage-related lysozyme (muramidase)